MMFSGINVFQKSTTFFRGESCDGTMAHDVGWLVQVLLWTLVHGSFVHPEEKWVPGI